MIYLDYNATTPIAPQVAEQMRPYLSTYFGNPSSGHIFGSDTKKAVEKARKQIAEMINAQSSEIIFTSGGTESNNYAIKGAAFARKHLGNHIITSAIEHPAVFEVCRYLERQGFDITYVKVDKYGRVNPQDVTAAIRPETILVSIMHANNEVGTIQPIAEISQALKGKDILLHSDAAQSIGKTPVDVQAMGIDLLSIAGHKLYAPKGIGALYVKEGVRLEKLIHGADHEQNRRAGTENVLEIVGLGAAAELVSQHLPDYEKHYAQTRDYLWELLQKDFPALLRNGHPKHCLANTLSVSFRGIEANTLVARLNEVATSAGAACHSESIDVSMVLEAMQVPIEYAMGTIRLSTGRTTTMEDIEKAAAHITTTVQSLKPREDHMSPTQKISTDVKLTQFTHGLGCACKMKPQLLEEVLKNMPNVHNKNVLVGTDTSDDAAAYLINKDTVLVQTLDFFTPIVDNPFAFGAIAAANALSDVYAMGAQPIFALNIVGFPENTLPLQVLQEILKGAQSKAEEAGIPILGGHTIEDPEPKFGMVVSGVVHPDKLIRNQGAQTGDSLVLTKALGTGIAATALKRGLLEPETQTAMTQLMMQLNKTAAECMQAYEVHACTDITGFGLLGHLKEMLVASDKGAVLHFDNLPWLPQVADLAAAQIIPGGSYNNLKHVGNFLQADDLSQTQQLMLADAQTSGGLLVALPHQQAQAYLQDLHQKGLREAAIVGEVTDKQKIEIIS